jgi:hypothetical protein
MIDQLIEKYIELRDKKAQLEAAHKAKLAPINDAMDKVEAHLLSAMQEQGTIQFKAAAGTAYKSVRTSATIADWDSLREFIGMQDDPYRFLDRRVNKTAVDEYVAEHNDLPPGVNYRTEAVVGIRRS